ncbi:DNA helicase [Tanacetum coccineum]|uniref:ATP-dependent DNA helicase n=1 Tax=Tanacetum coccineum TaxID=301880 RepID=A0ABQ5EWF5_9ASTR
MGGFGTTSDRQQYRSRFLYNRSGFPQTDFRHDYANEGWYIPVGNVVSHTSGYAEGGVILDFEDSTMRLLSKKHYFENVDNFRRKDPRYSRDYAYECLFRQSGSVVTQGESSRSDLVGEEQLRLMANSVQPFDYVIRDRPSSSLEGYSMDDQYSQRCSANKGPVILDFENSVVHLASESEVPYSLQVVNGMGMSAGRNVYPPIVDRTDQISACNVGHKAVGIGNSMGSRRRHTTERQTLAHVTSALTVRSVNAQIEGIGNNVGSRRRYTIERQTLLNVLSASTVTPVNAQLEENEVANRMRHFGGTSSGNLDQAIVQGLIGFLDKHNELVRLFRTAIDKCAGQFVPDFKIRLYSVVGAREYDLPTSQTLGGIVFQNGHNTKTDYDVIIKSRGGPVQRINKLHPSYMSLQFPLLFIFGQPSFDTAIKQSRVEAIDYYSNTLADVVVRVFQQKVQHFCRFLRDNRIFGTMTGQDIDHYISAEFPDPNKDLDGYRVVSEMMIYEPCRPPDPNTHFLKENRCSKKFPERYNDATYFNKDGYADYRRRETGVYTTRHVSDPMRLWCKYWQRMSNDIPLRVSKENHIPGLHINNPELEQHLLDELRNKELMEERSYNRDELTQEVTVLVQEVTVLVLKLNMDQKKIYDLIMDVAATDRQELIFVYGHEGTRKKFLWKTIINTLRSQGKIVLAVTSSSIASLLLPSGLTTHSKFKLPLELTDESMCKITRNTHAGLLTLKDTLDSPEKLFGGKRIVLGGDFRQTPLVKKGATKPEIITSSIAESYLWKHFKVCILKEKIRLLQPGNSEAEQDLARSFASWLLDISDGNIGEPDVKDSQSSFWVHIPERYCILDDNDGLSNLINFVYDKDTLQNLSAQELQQKATVCPRNNTAEIINVNFLSMVYGNNTIYKSSDEAVPLGNDRGAVELLYPMEYLNTLQLLGFPPHEELELKVGRC